MVFPQPGGPVISQVFCMARKRQAGAKAGLGMGIILTMPDQMSPVSESSVEVGHALFSGSDMVVSVAVPCPFVAWHVLGGGIHCLLRLPLIQPQW